MACSCRLDQAAAFCADVHQWLAADEQNVAAVHCKAGKGRTGTVICSYMVHAGISASAAAAMASYKAKRGAGGVTIASQRRYVEYYASLDLGQVVLPLPPVLRLEKLRLLEMPALGWTLDGEPPSYHCVVSAGAAGPAAAIVFDSGGKSGCGAQIDAAAWAASAPSTLELPLCW